MPSKPENPYVRLKNDFQKFADSVVRPRKVEALCYARNELHKNWDFKQIAYEVEAAARLGYDTRVTYDLDGLKFTFVKKPAQIPWYIE